MRARLVAQTDLSAGERDAMARLLATYFLGVTRTVFDRDLALKNWVLLLEEGPRLVGFSTLLASETRFEGELLTLLYSGDTIVAPDAWGRSSLASSWIEAVQSLRTRYPRGKLIWLLITSGFRTYRFLPVFWRDFYPRFDTPTPLRTQALLSTLATQLFGDRYDRERGTVCLESPQPLRNDLATVPEGRRADPHVAFFLERNPGWRQGDELVCVTEISRDNLTAAGLRTWLGAERRSVNATLA